MSTIGAEMGQLETLKSTFDRESQNVNQLTGSLTSTLGNTWWKGPAADRFRSQWDSEYSPMLRKLEASLQEAGQEVQRRHDALVQAGS